MTGLLLLLSSAAVPADDRASAPRTCGRSTTTSEIVICGPRPGESPYRLPKIAKNYTPKAPLKAEVQLVPGVSADSHLEAQGMADGKVSNRLMVTLKLKF
jgi:hypothetical protein